MAQGGEASALEHVSHVLACLVHRHSFFEDEEAPPRCVRHPRRPGPPISNQLIAPLGIVVIKCPPDHRPINRLRTGAVPEDVVRRVRRLDAESVKGELARLRRWLPSFVADGDRPVAWGEIADCLACALDALPQDAAGARAYARRFSVLVLSDAINNPPVPEPHVHAYYERAGLKSRHAASLLVASTEGGDASAAAALATLVAAGHVTASAAALLAGLRGVDDWSRRNALLNVAAGWRWAGTDEADTRRGDEARDAVGRAVRFALDEMAEPAQRGEQRRSMASALSAMLWSLWESQGSDRTLDGMFPLLEEIGELATVWKEKANAAAESARLLQAVVALMRRWRGETPLPDPPTAGVEIRGKNKDKKDKKGEPEPPPEEETKVEEVDEETKELRRRLEKEARLRRELKAALLSGIDGAKDDAKAAAIESVCEHFEAVATDHTASELQRAKREETVRALLVRVVGVGGAKGPPAALWGKVGRALKAASVVCPGVTLGVVDDMLRASGASKGEAKKEDKKKEDKKSSSWFGGSSKSTKSTDAPKPSKAVPGAGSANSRILALRFIAWAVEAVRDVPQDVGLEESGFESDPSTMAAKSLTVELVSRAGAFASSVAVAMTPPSGVGKSKGKFIDGELPDRIAYIAREVPPDAPVGDQVTVILTALRCTPLCLAAPAGTFEGKETTDHVIDIIAAGMGCGARDVEAAARLALRRHCDALSAKSLRRAVQLTLRSAEEAMEGSTDPEEWACRFKTAAAIVAEASRRTADDLYFDAVVEGIEARKEESASSETGNDATTGEQSSVGTPHADDMSVGEDESDSESMSPAVSAALSAAAAVGPRAASAILLATAHPDPAVHSAAAELLAATEDLVDAAALAADADGHGASAGEDGEDALASRLGGGLLRWLSSEASVGPETRSRAVAMLGGWRDDERVTGWIQKTPLSAAADEGVRRAAHRLFTARVIDYKPPSASATSGGSGGAAPSVHAYDMWKGHVAIYCAAARPRYYDSTQRSGDPEDDDSDAEGTARKGKKKKDEVNVEDAVDAAVAEDEEEEAAEGEFEDEEKFDDLEACFDSEQVLRWAWTRCGTAAEASAETGEKADDEARLRKEVMVDALAAAAPPCLSALVASLAKDITTVAKEILPMPTDEKELRSGTLPALNRASAGLVILRRLADRIIERGLPRSEAILSRVWATADAWLEPLSAVTDEALAPTFDQTDACASAANEAAALLKLRHSQAPPAEIDATDAAAKGLANSLPSKQASARWYEFIGTVLDAIDVVIDRKVSKKRGDLVIKRVARASRWMSLVDAEGDAKVEEAAKRSKSVASSTCVKLLLQRPDTISNAAAASLSQAAAASTREGERPGAAPTIQLLEIVVTAAMSRRGTNPENDGVVIAAALANLGLSPSLSASAAAYRGLRDFAGQRIPKEAAAAAVTAADAAAEAKSPGDAILSLEARRGAVIAATRELLATGPTRTLSVSLGIKTLADALGSTVDEKEAWTEAATATEPEFGKSRNACVKLAATSLTWVVEALATVAQNPVDAKTASALAEAALTCARVAVSSGIRSAAEGSSSAGVPDTSRLWERVGNAVSVINTERYDSDLRTAAESAVAVADHLVDACEESLEVTAMATVYLLRSPSGLDIGARLVSIATSGEGYDSKMCVGSARSKGAMRLAASSAACPVASITFASQLPSLVAAATSQRENSEAARVLLEALQIRDSNMNGVVESLARRYPEGRLACRRVLAKAAIRAADVAAGEDNRAKLSPAACASVASSLRLLVATVNPPRMNPSAKPHRAFPLERLADYAARCHRLFAFGLRSGEKGLVTSIAAADALATIAQRFSAGGASRESHHANVVTTASVSAAIAALSSTSIECICAGLRLAAACGLALPALTSAATAALSSNVAPAVGVAFDDGEFSFDQPSGSGKSDSSAAAAAIFSRLVLRKMPDIAAKPAHGRALDVARATLAALAGEASAENPLAAIVVLSMTLRSWPSLHAPPDVKTAANAARYLRSLDYQALDSVATALSLLGDKKYAEERKLDFSSPGAVKASPSRPGAALAAATAAAQALASTPGKALKKSKPSAGRPSGGIWSSQTPTTADKVASRVPDADDLAAKKRQTSDGTVLAAVSARRLEFFESICDGLADVKLAPSTWESSLHLLADTCSSDAKLDIRVAAADLMRALLKSRAKSEGRGKWNPRALSIAGSAMTQTVDDPAMALACVALSSAADASPPKKRKDKSPIKSPTPPDKNQLGHIEVIDSVLHGGVVNDEGSDVELDDDDADDGDASDKVNDDAGRLRSPVVTGKQEKKLSEWTDKSLLSVTAATTELMKQVTANRLHDEADDGSGSDGEDDAKGGANDPFEEFVPPDEFQYAATTTKPSIMNLFKTPTKAKSPFGGKSPLGNLGSAIAASRWRVKAGLGGATPVTTRDERRKARQKQLRDGAPPSYVDDDARSPVAWPGSLNALGLKTPEQLAHDAAVAEAARIAEETAKAEAEAAAKAAEEAAKAEAEAVARAAEHAAKAAEEIAKAEAEAAARAAEEAAKAPEETPETIEVDATNDEAEVAEANKAEADQTEVEVEQAAAMVAAIEIKETAEPPSEQPQSEQIEDTILPVEQAVLPPPPVDVSRETGVSRETIAADEEVLRAAEEELYGALPPLPPSPGAGEELSSLVEFGESLIGESAGDGALLEATSELDDEPGDVQHGVTSGVTDDEMSETHDEDYDSFTEEEEESEEEEDVDHLQRYLEMQRFTVGVHQPKKHPFDTQSTAPQSPETRLALSALKGRRRAQQFSGTLRNTRPS